MTTIRQVLAGLALCLAACGAPTDGGTGGGSAAGGGSGFGGGSQSPTNCQSRCEAHFSGCGVANPSAGCASLCTNLTATQLTCIEQQSCAENPDDCITTSNTGGGSGSTGGGSGSTGGGTASQSCAVSSAALKVSLPHTTARKVLFMPGSNCSPGGTWAGYNDVWNSMLFVDVSTAAQTSIHANGSLYEIEYRFEQRALGPNDKGEASTETGIPAAAIGGGEFLQRTSEAAFVVDGLPTDMVVVAQVTSSSVPSIKFVSSSSSEMAAIKTRLDGNGVQVNLGLTNMNGSVQRVGEFLLKGSTLKVLSLRP